MQMKLRRILKESPGNNRSERISSDHYAISFISFFRFCFIISETMYPANKIYILLYFQDYKPQAKGITTRIFLGIKNGSPGQSIAKCPMPWKKLLQKNNPCVLIQSSKVKYIFMLVFTISEFYSSGDEPAKCEKVFIAQTKIGVNPQQSK